MECLGQYMVPGDTPLASQANAGCVFIAPQMQIEANGSDSG